MSQQGTENRQRIIMAADELFYLRGYFQTSFSDIAKQTGIPRGNFYYYFKTKDDILEAVLDYRLQQVNDMLASCEAHSQKPQEQLLHLVDVLIREEDNIIHYGCPLGTISSELSKSAPELQAQVKNIFDALRQWIEQRLVSLAMDNSRGIAMDILARLQGTTVLANVYHDVDFLRNSAAVHRTWLESLLNRTQVQ